MLQAEDDLFHRHAGLQAEAHRVEQHQAGQQTPHQMPVVGVFRLRLTGLGSQQVLQRRGSSCSLGWCVWRRPWPKVRVISRTFMKGFADSPCRRGLSSRPEKSDYFKHGTAGLAEVYVIGIKEFPSGAFSLPQTQLIGTGQQAAQVLSNLLFPSEAIRVIPLAFFRKLTKIEPEA
jgi:hypothetical protein